MNLTNLLDYSNSVYNFSKEINSVKRKNVNALAKPETVLKMLIVGAFTKNPSINLLMYGVHNSNTKRLKNIFSKKEFIPKTHAFRDCVNDIDYKDIQGIHYKMIDKLKINKFFENQNYRGNNVMIIDGIETFETHKNIEGLHYRKHKNDLDGYYYKALGLMYMSDNVDLMIDLLPFEKHEVENDTEHSEKVKSEGEITVFKKVIPTLTKYNIDICVADAMFLNGPCLNTLKEQGINAVIRLKDKKRNIYKDASKLFEQIAPTEEYEVVKVIESKKVKYGKESKKKDTFKSEEYTYTRSVTKVKVGKKKIMEEKEIVHPKKTIYKKRTEEVVKKVKVWSDEFELTNYEYGNVRVIRTIEEQKNKTDEVYLVTTLLNESLEFIIDLMHRRWDIELNGFRKLQTRYNLDHLFIGTDNAIRLISYVILIVYNLIELYFNVHTKKYRQSMNFDNLLEDYKIEITTVEIYKYFLVT